MELKTKTSSFCTFVRYSAGMPVWYDLWLVESLVDGQKFPSHWPSGRLLYESTIVRKLNVYSFSNQKTISTQYQQTGLLKLTFLTSNPKLYIPSTLLAATMQWIQRNFKSWSNQGFLFPFSRWKDSLDWIENLECYVVWDFRFLLDVQANLTETSSFLSA